MPIMAAADVALLGLGPWGRNHQRVLGELGALRSVYDANPGILDLHGAPGRSANSLEAILGDPEVRAVVVATPARTHYELALRALKAGKDVLVEKPLTLDEAHGEDLVRRARRGGRVLMVGHVTLYHPAIRTLVELVDGGELGNLRYLYANRLNLGTVREEEDILWSFAPHDVAVFLRLVGSWPHEVAAHGGSYLRPGRADVTVTHLDFPRGVRGHVFVSWLHPEKEHRLVVMGDRRMATFTDGPGGGELVLSEGVPPESGAAPPPPRVRAVVPFPKEEPLRNELEHFLHCVRTREEPLSGGRHGLEVLRVLETAHRSLATGGRTVPCAAVTLETGS